MILISKKQNTTRLRFMAFIFLMAAFNLVVHAQSKDSTTISIQPYESPNKLLPTLNEAELEISSLELLLLPEKQNILQTAYYQEYWLMTSPNKADKLTLSQDNTPEHFPNLGESSQFSGNLLYQATNKLKVGVGLELLKQNTVLTPWNPNYQLGFCASAEYSFNKWLSAYIYGEYVSPSLNQKHFFDPLQYMNPLFKQTEFGSGLRAKHKNIKADVGVKTIQGKDFTETNSSSYFNSKITVGF